MRRFKVEFLHLHFLIILYGTFTITLLINNMHEYDLFMMMILYGIDFLL